MLYIYKRFAVSFKVMIDLHMHTIFSDGVLLPAELARRAEAAGYEAMCITDHVDMSNLDFAVPRIVEAARALTGTLGCKVLPGAEITHVPPALIGRMVEEARKLGAKIVVVHGESPVEPVAPGTNRAAIEARADILAHPGLITDEDAALAAKNGVALEITTRKGHSLTNGHVAAAARRSGALMVVNTDTHEPGDLVSRAFAERVLRGAGISEDAAIAAIFENSRRIADR